MTVEKKGSGDSQDLAVCNNIETLLYLVNQGCFTFHPWLSRGDHPNQPDRAVIDLDPSDDDPQKVRKAALVVAEELTEKGTEPLPTTTGSSGYHLVLPFRRGKTFDQVREHLTNLTRGMEKDHPDLLRHAPPKVHRKESLPTPVAQGEAVGRQDLREARFLSRRPHIMPDNNHFQSEWNAWPDRECLTDLCHGDHDLALLLYRVAGKDVWNYLDARPSFLQGSTPRKWLATRKGRHRLHSALLKFPYL